MFRLILGCFLITLTACSGGAVVFAPTLPPPDLSPLSYTHPSGAFSVAVPRQWSVYAQNTTELASAAFALPGEDEPALRFAVMNLGERADSETLRAFIDQYQIAVRPDAGRYSEVNRQAMGDGSWRLAGLRQSAGGITQQVNTFIQQTGTLIGVIEVLMPGDGSREAEFQSIINSFAINTDAQLQPAEASALAFAAPSSLNILHVSSWTTSAGVFFITGEVGNYGTAWVDQVPVRAVLRSADGLSVADAADSIMGYGIPPGGFAPFSLRFGGGQPALAADYQLILGGENWQPATDVSIADQATLKWSDDSSVSAEGRLTITGRVTNQGQATVYNLRAVVTVFDTTGNAIAAGFTELASLLNSDASADFQIVVPEMGGSPVNYIVNVQGVA
jgi:hypothetical protein